MTETPIFDSYGLPQHFTDSGDCPSNVGRIALYTENWETFFKQLELLWDEEAQTFKRHPVQKHDVVGSDQLEPIMLALLLEKYAREN